MIVLLLLCFVLSALACGVYLHLAKRWQLLAHPNERSSHKQPTPHGGGLPLMLAFAAAVVAAALSGVSWPGEYWLLLAAALTLTAVGVWDDFSGLSVRFRIGLYCLCATLVCGLLLRPLNLPPLYWVALCAVASFAALWLLNLYNFMDGIDGIAASQCALVCIAAAWLSYDASTRNYYSLYCLLLASAHAGFLLWNWPPARLFMGDAGSVPTGFLLAALAILGAMQGRLPLGCWLILMAVFICDASWTLLQRMLSGQNFTQAHRQHAYQRLSRRWNSHRKVDIWVLFINVFWLLPLAWLAQNQNYSIISLVIMAYLPLLFAMVKIRRIA